MAFEAAPYVKLPSLRLVKRAIVRYALSLCLLIVPAALTPVLLAQGKALHPIISALYILAVAAAGWWGGAIAGILVSFGVVPVFTGVVTHGKAFLPPHLDWPAMVVLIAIAVMVSQVATSRRRVEEVLVCANEQLEGRVKERTEELEHARNWLETTLASIGDAVIATDSKGKLLFLNGTAQKLTGWKQDEALGRPLADVFVIRNEATDAAAADPVAKVLATGAICGLANHTVLISRDGRRIPIDDSAAPICEGDAGVSGVVLVFRDITERRQSECAADQARQQLEQNNQELQQFAYAASHDLQEPLRNITIYAQLLERRYSEQLDSNAAGLVHQIMSGAEQMNTLLHDLLSYARLWGTTPKEVEPADLRGCLDAVLSSMSATIAATEARIEYGDLPRLHMSEVHLQQLLQNIIGNALKYRGPQPPEISIQSERNGGNWVIRIADNGIGIEPRNQQRIFEPFKRLHSNDEYPGTGIGLALCQKVVQRYNGRIWVNSELGKGSTFYFSVPDGTGRVGTV
jgi:PAS domain S-box-containing protein